MPLLQPYRPSAREPWDEERAAHLARRSGFGATQAEIANLTEAGLEGAVAARVDYPDAEPELEALIRSAGTPLLRNDPQAEKAAQGVMRLRQLWLFRMAHTSAPLREKLALFWHDHFATQQQKVVREELVFAHLETLRRLGATSMRELLGAVARDPAMLVFLDNRLSQKTKPNENWARELLELFSVGLGPYDQADVRALARVFTGWTTPQAHVPEFSFDPELHDGGDKTVLGRTIRGRGGDAGIEEGEEVLDLLASHPACTRSIATKLARWFVTHTPPAGLIASIDSDLAANGGSIRETLRALFSSEAFYAPEFRFCLHKNPVEYAVSATRVLNVQNAHLCALPGPPFAHGHGPVRTALGGRVGARSSLGAEQSHDRALRSGGHLRGLATHDASCGRRGGSGLRRACSREGRGSRVGRGPLEAPLGPYAAGIEPQSPGRVPGCLTERTTPRQRPRFGAPHSLHTRIRTGLMNAPLNRREFLRAGSLVSAGAALAPGWLARAARSAPLGDRRLIVVELRGGNDGLNTVVPIADDRYYRERSVLGLRDGLLPLDELNRFHPSLKHVSRRCADGAVSVVQQVGYANTNLSHFESQDIWHEGRTDSVRSGMGWLGRWRDSERGTEAPGPELALLSIGERGLPLSLRGRGASPPAVRSLGNFRFQGSRGRGELARLEGEARLAAMRSIYAEAAGDEERRRIQQAVHTAQEASLALQEAARLEGSANYPPTPPGP